MKQWPIVFKLRSTMRILLLIFLAPSLLFSNQLQIDICAPTAILINAKTGAILFEKQAHLPSFPASITKIATALYAMEKKGSHLDELVTVVQDDIMVVPPLVKRSKTSRHPLYRLESDGTSMGLKAGEVLPLRVLLYGMLLRSGNDAANVIARYVSGDINQFMRELNLYLKEKGIKESLFLNPSGLHIAEHKTTAYDMSLIAKEVLKSEILKNVVKTVRFSRPQTNKNPAGELVQTNRLLKPGQYFYSKAIGVKTGHTGLAGFTLVSAAKLADRVLIAVILRSETAPLMYQDAIKLFDAAFAQQLTTRTLFAKQCDLFTQTIKGAKQPLKAQLYEDLVTEYYPAEEPVLNAQIRWKQLCLPIEAGQEVGLIELIDDKSTLIQSSSLFAVNRIEKTFSKALIDLLTSHRNGILFTIFGLNLLLILLYFLKQLNKSA
jgi:D-alanyl-D-alanine carboxypeptidase (penicillin-binding protein 5/6)